MTSFDPVIESIKRNSKVSKDLALLFISRVLMRISLGSLGVFLPIFLYLQFREVFSTSLSIMYVILIFVAIYSLHLLLSPITARMFHTLGMRRLMIVGILLSAASIVSLYFVENNMYLGIAIYIISTGFYRAFYWVPYHVDLTHELDSNRRGRQLAMMANISDVLIVMVPFLGGVAIAALGGFQTVFLTASFLMLLSVLPLLFINDVYEYYSWSYIETFKKMFSKENRPLFISQAANGAQSIVTLFFWPLYVFLIVDKQFVLLGLITSVTIVLIMIIRYLVGKWVDKFNREKMLLAGVLLSATGWFLKVFVHTPVQAVFIDTYHRIGRTVNGLTFNAVTYEQSADSGTYIDEYTTLKEMAINFGRIAMLVVIGLIMYYLDINMRVAFIVAALVTLLMIMLDRFNRLN